MKNNVGKYERTEEIRKKLSEAHKLLYKNGYVHPMEGKHQSEEAKNKMSKFKKGKTFEELVGKEKAIEWKKNLGRASLGRKHTQEFKDMIKLSRKIIFNEEETKKIINLYEKELLSANKIAKIFNVSNSTIFNLLRENNILLDNSLRRKKLYQFGKLNIISPMKGKHHTEEQKHKVSLALLGEKNPFYGKHHTPEISKQISETLKSKHLIPHNKGKNYEESYGEEKAIKLKERLVETHSGEKSPSFNNWSSREPYDENWNKSFRNAIRKRDNQVCMNCGKHREKLNRALSVHHINSDKKCSFFENCISLCTSCHGLTKVNRPYWQKLFQEKLSKLYGYQYSEDGKIVLQLNGEIKNELGY